MLGNSRRGILLAALFAAIVVGVVGCSFLGGMDGSISPIASLGEQTPAASVPLADQVSFRIVLPVRAPNINRKCNEKILRQNIWQHIYANAGVCCYTYVTA